MLSRVFWAIEGHVMLVQRWRFAFFLDDTPGVAFLFTLRPFHMSD